MNKKSPIVLMLLVVMLAACIVPAVTTDVSPPTEFSNPTAAAPVTDTPSTTPSPTITMFPTRTLRPTSTPITPGTPRQTLAPTPTLYHLPDDFPIAYPPGAVPEGAIVRSGIGNVLVVELSPDEQWIAIGTMTGLYVLDVNTYDVLWSVTTEWPVCGADWSPDGSMISYQLGCTWRISGRVADSRTGDTIREFNSGWSLDWAPRTSLLAVINRGMLEVWDTETWDLHEQCIPEEGFVFSNGEWSPDGRLLVISAKEGVRVIDANSYEVVYSLEVEADHPRIVLSPDSRYMTIHAGEALSGGSYSDWYVDVYELSSGELLYRYGHEAEGESAGPVTDVAFSPDGSLMVVEGILGYSLVDIPTGDILHSRQSYPSAISGVSPDGKYVIPHIHRYNTNPMENYLGLWNIETGEMDAKWPLIEGAPDWMAGSIKEWFGDSQRFLISYNDKLMLWHITEGTPRSSLAFVSALYYSYYMDISVFWSPDSQLIAVPGYSDGSYNIWDASTGDLVGTVQDETELLGWIESQDHEVYTRDENFKYEDYADETIQIHVMEEGEGPDYTQWIEIENFLTGETFPISETWVADDWELIPYIFVYSPNGKRIALVYREPGRVSAAPYNDAQANIISVWDIETGERLHRFVGHTVEAYAVAFSPDGTRLASVSGDGTIVIWDVE